MLASDLQVQVTSSNGCANVSVPIIAPLNTDDRPASSATETFDAVGTVWTTTAGTTTWSHVRETGLDGIMSGSDASFTSDASLVSPPLTAGPGNLTISFSHKFSFELTPASGATPSQAFDGGVIEFSTDSGATWTDIGLVANPGYTATLLTGGTNPLAGRRAFGGTNPSFPASDNFTLFLGNRLAGKTFQLRFRIGTDSNTGGAGWQIDDIAFTGLVGTPFPILVPSAGKCKGSGGGGGGGGGVRRPARPRLPRESRQRPLQRRWRRARRRQRRSAARRAGCALASSPPLICVARPDCGKRSRDVHRAGGRYRRRRGGRPRGRRVVRRAGGASRLRAQRGDRLRDPAAADPARRARGR
jgi:hypothetical protein